MAQISINNISISFGGPRVLDGATLRIDPGERIGLLGRNGSGKSTLMKTMNGDIVPDEGDIIKNGDVKIDMLPQDVPDDLPGTVYDVVASGGQEFIDRLQEYHELTLRIARQGEDKLIKKLENSQHKLETSGAWHYHQRVGMVIKMTGLDENALFKNMSAGLKRRVFLARALVNEPDILLLDEPTNHLDINSILWLEDFLLKCEHTIMFVTHDRAFLKKLSTRIVEIDRGRLISFGCDYRSYLERREALLETQEKHAMDFDKKLAKEEAWIRQGIKARRTRNEGRVRALMKMRQERSRRRETQGSARLVIQEAERSGRLVVDADKISFAYGDTKIIENFSTTIMRADRVGIIGPNGCGKTTLLKVLLGELAPQKGRIRLGTRIRIAYFDQLRAQLDESMNLKENIAGKGDKVFVGSVPRHIVGYLKDFLFSREQIMAPVRSLSGGERNRLLLAKLFATPSNVMVLDEPTNDLDAETLELFEERLMEYSGTVLMVSHDRAFLNNVVTSTIVFEEPFCLQEYVGGYDDWLSQRKVHAEASTAAQKQGKPKNAKPLKEKSKLSYRESRELDELPKRIDEMEEEKRILIATLNEPEFYVKNDAGTIKATNEKLEDLERKLDKAYGRWNELEDLAAKFK